MSLYDAGAKLIDTLVEGVKAMAMKPVETVKGIYKDIKGAFGFGDDEEPQSAKAAVEGAKAAYPGKDTASKQETGFWEGVGDFFTFGSNPEQAALQPAAAGTPSSGRRNPPSLKLRPNSTGQAPGQARTAPASSHIPEYAHLGRGTADGSHREHGIPSAQQPVNLHFPCPSPSTASLRTWATRCCAASTASASAIEERIARMLGNIVGDQGGWLMATEYITQQGDCWDAIALRLCGAMNTSWTGSSPPTSNMDMLGSPPGSAERARRR